ncbi:wd g-beta repeat-containing protein [Cystoisospora suis]|uniref:Intraflagellar transport protein 122 homolog n=1 Tax=Cystoisospora suis TaxID=483139 RepID=A0A2C6JUT8_9APIC|nr:wd g-beta repeat-containing protein [Cystoisospora suis]
MESQRVWHDAVPAREGLASVIWSLAFSPDGSRLLAAVRNCVLMYESSTGKIIQTLKAHKDTVYAIKYSKNGKLFASGGADRTVIIWTDAGSGWRKYTHSDSIQCLAFNPVTLQLASATAVDLGLWSPELPSVGKLRLPAKACCLDWTPDGNLLAIGLYSGIVSIRDTTGAEKWSIALGAPVWTLAWSPAGVDDGGASFIVVGTFNQQLTFHRLSGEACFRPLDLRCDPLCISFAPNGSFFVVAGSDGSLLLCSHDGVSLGSVGQTDDWAWSCAVHPGCSRAVVGSNSGEVQVYSLNFPIVHGLYQDRYAHRDKLTDVVVRHMRSDQSVRIKYASISETQVSWDARKPCSFAVQPKSYRPLSVPLHLLSASAERACIPRCRNLVKKIAVFKELLAIMLPEEVVIYSADPSDSDDMTYQLINRISQALDCSLMLITSSHLIRCTKAKLQLYTLSGIFEREWDLGSIIRYIKVLGGPVAAEGILAGLKNGQVVEIFTNNPFPVILIKEAHPIACLDISLLRTKLAVVDSTQRMTVYGLDTNEVLYRESNVTSVAWNLALDDMLSYTGCNILSIRCGAFPPHTQRLQGFVVGFRGSKIYCLRAHSVQTYNVPLSASMHPYLKQSDFRAAYRVACLGVTNSDWLSLALCALVNLDFDLSTKAFTRLKDLRGIRLIQQVRAGVHDESMPLMKRKSYAAAMVAAFQGAFVEAAFWWIRAGHPRLAVELFSGLKRWREAKAWAAFIQESTPLLRGSTEWGFSVSRPSLEDQAFSTGLENTQFRRTRKEDLPPQGIVVEDKGHLHFAAGLYLRAKKHRRAVELYGQLGALDKVISIVRGDLREAERKDVLHAALTVFNKHRHFPFARETLSQLDNKEEMAKLLVEHKRWEDALLLAQQEPSLAMGVYIPWSMELIKSDRFEDAIEALKRGGRPDLSYVLLLELLDSCITQRRFQEASRWCWTCASEILKHASSCVILQSANHDSTGHHSLPDTLALQFFFSFRRLAEIYLAYHVIIRREEGIFPFRLGVQAMKDSTFSRETIVFDAAAFLWNYILAPPLQNSGDNDSISERWERSSVPKCSSDWGGAAKADHRKRVHPYEEALEPWPRLDQWRGRGDGQFERALDTWANRFAAGFLPGISEALVLHALAESSLRLKAYKVGRIACQKLQRLRVPERMQKAVDDISMRIRSKTSLDENHAISVVPCAWCGRTESLFSTRRIPVPVGEVCGVCGHARLREFGGFSPVTSVEFLPPQNMSEERVEMVLKSSPFAVLDPLVAGPTRNENCSFLTEGAPSRSQEARSLTADLFRQKLSLPGFQADADARGQATFIPPQVPLDLLRTLQPETVCILSHNSISSLLATQYFVCVDAGEHRAVGISQHRSDSASERPTSPDCCQPDLRRGRPERRMVVCSRCIHVFDLDKTEEFVLDERCCPLCGTPSTVI